MAKQSDYCIVLSNKQEWLTKNEFEHILLELSKEYREHLYLKGEFENSYFSGDEYIYVNFGSERNSENSCYEIGQKLRDVNIVYEIKKYEEVYYDNYPEFVSFSDQIIWPDDEYYDDEDEDEDEDEDDDEYDDESYVYDCAIVINNNQPWVTRKQFARVLLESSKNSCRKVIYSKNDFENHVLDYGLEYVFMSFDTDYESRKSSRDTLEFLKNNNIICRIEENYTVKNLDTEYEQIIKFKDEMLKTEEDIYKGIKKINEPSSQIDETCESNFVDANNNLTRKILDIKQILSIDKMYKFDEFFNNKIIGQNPVIEKIKTQLITKLYEFNDPNNTRPAGIFFFVGPTGVGKTEVCKQLSEFLYNNREINRLDMSEYKSDVAIQKLIGAPNGYVGYEEGGVLTNKLEQNPNAILLFDEIEKADKSVFDLFLQMFDEGIITSNKGKKFILKNTFIILTSNIGAANIETNHSYDQICNEIKNEINDFFVYELNRPEILGRIGKDNIIVFNTINKKEDQYKILDIYFNQFVENFKKNNVSLVFNKNQVYDAILQDVDITKGARDIRNEFDEFKKHFNLSLFENKVHINSIKNMNINFNYDNVKVQIEINNK